MKFLNAATTMLFALLFGSIACGEETLPSDLPLAASPPNNADWLRRAVVLQPVYHSTWTAVVDAERHAREMREDFGFNTVIFQPPDSHNAWTGGKDPINEQQFQDALAVYRREGYRILLYTSLMANGISPEFQSGQIDKEHPEWRQRDAAGNPVLVWDVPWLCPNTGARELALERCLHLVREYQPDGLMLDNNQFFFSADGGWTCHCDACSAKFRDYVNQRFGADAVQRLFGVPTEQLAIPTEEGPLFSLWMHWRNRVWAEVNEAYRARLRTERPDIMFFANTQFLFDSGVLASDEQYEREDVVLSESVGLNSQQLSAKLVLGHALAAGRPLWNYIGTFVKAENYTGLQPSEIISPLIASTLAHGARPWIVDGFDEGPTDAAARKAMSRLLAWSAAHPELFEGERRADVATIVSPESRNVLKRPLLPPHMTTLQTAGVPVIALRDRDVTAETLRPFKVVTIETAGVLSEASAAALATWVRGGGELLAVTDAGRFDELGRPLPRSVLWQALGLDRPPSSRQTVGRGRVSAPSAADFTAATLKATRPYSYRPQHAGGLEVVSYRAPKRLILHVVHHQADLPSVMLQVPETIPARAAMAELIIPGSDAAQSLSLKSSGGRATFELPAAPPYCVVRIPLD